MRFHEVQPDCRWSVTAKVDEDQLTLRLFLRWVVDVLFTVESTLTQICAQMGMPRLVRQEIMTHTYFEGVN